MAFYVDLLWNPQDATHLSREDRAPGHTARMCPTNWASDCHKSAKKRSNPRKTRSWSLPAQTNESELAAGT